MRGFCCSFISAENWSAQGCLDYVSPVLFYFEFCEILKTFSHISTSRGLLFDDTSEQPVCVIRGQITEKFARKASRSCGYVHSRLIEAFAALDGTDVARECIRRVLFAVVASRVAFISSPSGMNFAQLGFGRKPRNYTSLSVLLS